MPVTTSEPKFNCGTCGKEYRWKPELAGKKAKCKCGNVIAVPAKAPASAAAAKPAARPAPKPAEQDIDLDGLYALAQEEKKATVRAAHDVVDEPATGYRCPSCSHGIPPGTVVCPNCRTDMRTGMRQVAVAGGGGVLAAAGAYAAATPTARAATLGYAGGRPGSRADEDILYEGGKARSLYLPLGLIVLGVLFYFGQLAFSNDRLSAGIMILLVGARIIMDSVLIFISMLIAVRGFDMGFGAFGPGVLKILAIAMGPGALGQLATQWMGGGAGGWMVGGFITIVLYYTLIKVLFNLDLGETFLLVFLIYGVQQVLGTFLLVALMGMASSGALSGEGAVAIGGGAMAVATAGEDVQEFPPKRMLDPEEIVHDLDRSNQKWLNGLDGGTEAVTWIGDSPLRTMGLTTLDESRAFLANLSSLGAQNIRMMDYNSTKTPDGKLYEYATTIMVELPTDPAQRKQIFDIRSALEQKLKLEPEMVRVEVGGDPEEKKKEEPLKDWGQRLLDIRLVGNSRPVGVGGNGGDANGDDEDDEGDEEGDEMDEDAAAAAPAEKPADATPAPGASEASDASGGGTSPAPETPTPAPTEPAPAGSPF